MYSRNILLLLLISTLTFSHNVFALNILAIVSLPMRSHYMAFQTLFREMANRGHSVTVMNNFPDHEPPPKLKFVDLSGNLPYNRTMSLETYESMDSSYLHLYNVYRHFVLGPTNTYNDCENLFTNKNAIAHLSKKIKYDVIFVEQFMSDCGLAYALALYDAPIIGITSHVLLPWSYPRLGIPFDYSSQSFYFSNAGPNPSLYHKVESAVIGFYFNTISRWNIHRNIYSAFNRYLPSYTLDIERQAKERIKMMFSYQHFSLTGARTMTPQLLEIAGIHIGKPKPLSKDIEKFLSDATDGAIYVSFGSNLKASTMSQNKLQQFLEAFKRIPQKVLFKWENVTTFPTGHKNIFIDEWLPQLDILCHPKVIAFVSHGGMLSMSEATHCGKPLLAIPFFGDQFSNAAMVRASGLGNTMFFDEINADNLERAINELTSQKMQQNVNKISKLWHDRPQSVMDSAIYWTEYVGRHGGLAPPSLPSKYNTWFETALLDVYIVIITLLLAVVLLIYVIFKLLKLILVKLLMKFVCISKSKTD